MRELFHCEEFAGFGPSGFDGPNELPSFLGITGRRAGTLRKRVRQSCPRWPGVYGMLNANHELIYVGKAKCLRSRLLSYFRTRSRDPKAGRILRQTGAIVWEYAHSEFAALLRELQLIRRWRPRFNVQGQPGRRRPVYVCIGRKPAPYVFLARFPPKDVSGCFGPIPASWRAREAIRRLNDVFQLRDCPQAQSMVFAEERELFPMARAAGCLRYEICTCLGPCIGACTRRDYMAQVRAAQVFLRGKDSSILEMLERDMIGASSALAYEKAAAIRDKQDVLRWLQDRLGRLRSARHQQSFIYPVRGHDGSERWHLIHGGRVLATLPAPQDEAGCRAAKQTIHKVFRQKPLEKDPVPADEIDGVLLVAAWFRRHPEESDRVLPPAEAIRLVAIREGSAAFTSEVGPL